MGGTREDVLERAERIDPPEAELAVLGGRTPRSSTSPSGGASRPGWEPGSPGSASTARGTARSSCSTPRSTRTSRARASAASSPPRSSPTSPAASSASSSGARSSRPTSGATAPTTPASSWNGSANPPPDPRTGRASRLVPTGSAATAGRFLSPVPATAGRRHPGGRHHAETRSRHRREHRTPARGRDARRGPQHQRRQPLRPARPAIGPGHAARHRSREWLGHRRQLDVALVGLRTTGPASRRCTTATPAPSSGSS